MFSVNEFNMRRLVMYKSDLCSLCNKIDEDCKVFSPDNMYGWVYCPECYKTGRMKDTYLKYIEEHKEIPLQWIFSLDRYKSDNKDDELLKRQLYFYRHSRRDTEPKHIGNLYVYDSTSKLILYNKKNDSLFINLNFFDKKTNCEMSRLVSLENIFANNKYFYEDLCNDVPLFNDGNISLLYGELPKNIKEMVEKCYASSKKTSVFIK